LRSNNGCTVDLHQRSQYKNITSSLRTKLALII
ncbi:MAG: hypothetical protein ACI971_000272, partial [Colwellia sp.]